jgi:tRNA G18 (ribose-2'-O)-methylase SpoU
MVPVALNAGRLNGRVHGAQLVNQADDPRLADYVNLRDPDLRVRVERDRGFFVAESPHVVRALVRSGHRVRSVLVTPHQHAALAGTLEGLAAPVYVAPPTVLRAVVGFDLHRGAVAAGDRWPLPPPSTVLDGARTVLFLEAVNDHENLGGIFRHAAAFGVDAVLLDEQCADPLYRRCVRVSIGHVLSVPWTRGSLADVVAAGVTPIALTPRPDARPIDALQWPPRVALALGAEGPGLSGATLAACAHAVRIPMADAVDSLNIVAAAAIACYERGRAGARGRMP